MQVCVYTFFYYINVIQFLLDVKLLPLNLFIYVIKTKLTQQSVTDSCFCLFHFSVT